MITVGGGLGGASLARALALAGVRVLVIERESSFRDRVHGEQMHCWGVAEARALAIDQLLRDSCGHEVPFRSVQIAGMPELPPRDLVETASQKRGRGGGCRGPSWDGRPRGPARGTPRGPAPDPRRRRGHVSCQPRVGADGRFIASRAGCARCSATPGRRPRACARALPRLAAEPRRAVDLVGLGPDGPSDEAASRRFFGED